MIVSGSVRVLAEDGHEIVRLEAGNSFGEFSLLLGTPHQHDVYAVEDCELMVVPKELFDELVGSEHRARGEAEGGGRAASAREPRARGRAGLRLDSK